MLVVHNMSVPSRTEVRAEKRGIADRIVVFSLQYALIASGVLEAPEVPEKLPKGKELQNVAQDGSSDLRVTVRARWPSPGDLFTRIGEPKTLQIAADFLIGWRVGILADGWFLCPDPHIVAGVQARCSGNLYLSRRDPDLSWKRLLSAPIAFDEPALALSSHEYSFQSSINTGGSGHPGTHLQCDSCGEPSDGEAIRAIRYRVQQ
jgi:hypothetical protein